MPSRRVTRPGHLLTVLLVLLPPRSWTLTEQNRLRARLRLPLLTRRGLSWQGLLRLRPCRSRMRRGRRRLLTLVRRVQRIVLARLRRRSLLLARQLRRRLVMLLRLLVLVMLRCLRRTLRRVALRLLLRMLAVL